MSYYLSGYGGGMGAWLTGDMVKQQMMAGAAGAGGILITSAVLQRIPLPEDWEPMTKSRVKNAIAIGIGVLGGRMIWEKNRDAAMGFVGGVAGLGLAQLIASWAPDTLSTSLSGGLADVDLASLEASNVHASPGFSGPQVSERSLSAPGVSREFLAEADYAPFLS